MTEHKMVPECITTKETWNRDRERVWLKKTPLFVLPVLIVAFFQDLPSGLGFATGNQTPAHKTW